MNDKDKHEKEAPANASFHNARGTNTNELYEQYHYFKQLINEKDQLFAQLSQMYKMGDIKHKLSEVDSSFYEWQKQCVSAFNLELSNLQSKSSSDQSEEKASD